VSRQTLHEAFHEAAERRPDAIAVSDSDRSLTYAELELRANRLAHRLRALGAGPEVLVGLCVPRTVDLIVGMLAILKAGAGYLPLDPRYPADRLRALMTDAGCGLVVGEAVADVPSVRPDDASLAAEPSNPPETDAGPDSLAYVIHTSGSTGQPKGVAVSHENVRRLFSATRGEFEFSGGDVWTMFHSASFDFSVWEIWGALLAGGRLVIVSYEVSRDPEAFLRLLTAEGVTVLSQTPSAFRQLVRAAEAAGFPATSLRTVTFGGEELDPAVLRGWIDHYGDAEPRLINMYGITETTVHVTMRRIGAADLDASGSTPGSPIGVPLDDMRVYVLDDDLQPVAPGRTGEMYVAGAGVSRGYLNRPELTAERFVEDPFGEPGSVMYRSGDLAEIGPDGGLIYRGRADRQLQLRGFRIEPGEIEAAVRTHPDVRDTVVVMRRDGSDEQRLACYWVPRPDTDPSTSAESLRAHMTALLPDHMVPGSFTALDRFPLTPNGKLDEAALPSPRPAGPTRTAGRPAEAAQPAAGPERAEERLAEIWADLLEMDDVGDDEDFFTLGGDSILATEMVAEARAAGIAISVSLLFAHPTIARLARASADLPR
jgi:amino acid adenylation domain-containing protein